MSEKSIRKTDIILIVAFLAVLYGFLAAFVLMPDKASSEKENRTLAQLPDFSSYDYFDTEGNSSSFAYDVAEYFSDQFPLRDTFVTAHAAVELAMLKNENNGVIIGTGGYLIKRHDAVSTDKLEANLGNIAAFTETMESAGRKTLFALAGRSIDVLEKYYPPYFAAGNIGKVSELAQKRGALLLADTLKEHADGGEYVYYKTDHHWTTLGAYYAYRELCGALDITPAPRSEFTEEIVADDFLGTTYSTAALHFGSADKITFFRYDGDNDFTTEIVGGKSFSGFYDNSYLAAKDKYSAFLSGNNAHIRVTKNGEENRPTMLVIKDSFSHSLIPFLARHYNLEIIDPRYYNGSVAALADECGADTVLILMGTDTLADYECTRILRLK